MTYNYEVYDWNGEQDRLTYSAECDTLEQCYDELMLECRIYGIKWTGDINRNRKALEKAINQRIIIRECPFRGSYADTTGGTVFNSGNNPRSHQLLV